MTLLKFAKDSIETAVIDAINHFTYYRYCGQSEEHKLQFCLNLHEALQHSTGDDIQMSLDDFVIIKEFM